MNPYLLLKLLHILAVVIFLGNIITGLFWMKQADKTGDVTILSFTMKSIIASDRLFTLPGVLIIIAGGVGGALQAGLPMLKTGWIFWSLVLFTISGIAFMIKVAPLQKKIYEVTLEKNFNSEKYHRLLRQWENWGLVAMLTPLGALVMMVLKLPLRSVF